MDAQLQPSYDVDKEKQRESCGLGSGERWRWRWLLETGGLGPGVQDCTVEVGVVQSKGRAYLRFEIIAHKSYER